MQKAWSSFNVKALNSDRRQLEGLASTPETDRVGDQLISTGATFNLPIVLLHSDDHQKPIGLVADADVSRDGIKIKAEISKVTDPGPLKDRVDCAWGEIRAGLIRGLSVGFQPLPGGVEVTKTGARYLKWSILEISAVAIPANASATIQTIKSMDMGRTMQRTIPMSTSVNLKPYSTLPPGLCFTDGQRQKVDRYISAQRERERLESEVNALHLQIDRVRHMLDVSENDSLVTLRRQFVEVRASLRRAEVAERSARREVTAFVDLG